MAVADPLAAVRANHPELVWKLELHAVGPNRKGEQVHVYAEVERGIDETADSLALQVPKLKPIGPKPAPLFEVMK